MPKAYLKKDMNRAYKVSVFLFLIFQSMMIFGVFPKKIQPNFYTGQVFMQIMFSICKFNNLYNFFTDPQDTHKYNYTTNNIYLLKKENDEIIKLPISLNEIVLPINYARINNIQSIALTDTLLYEAMVRSEALFFFRQNKSYPVIYFEVLNHQCDIRKVNNRFIKDEKIDTVYSNYFSLD